MDQDAETLDVSMSLDEMLAGTRSYLQAALELLGEGGAETVLDASLAGAAILARDASELLKGLLRERTGLARVPKGG
ncbi:MAG: hypothetical protein ACRBN8_24090 [Nannocystales bacterium]